MFFRDPETRVVAGKLISKDIFTEISKSRSQRNATMLQVG